MKPRPDISGIEELLQRGYKTAPLHAAKVLVELCEAIEEAAFEQHPSVNEMRRDALTIACVLALRLGRDSYPGEGSGPTSR